MTRGYLTCDGAHRLGVAHGIVQYDATDGQCILDVYRDGARIGSIVELGENGIIPLADLTRPSDLCSA